MEFILPNPTDLIYFTEVAQSQNISRAAERLGVTQPTLSSSLQRLESNLGAPVFIRSRTGVQLTAAGSELLLKSRQLLNEWSQIKSSVSKNITEMSGQYIIGAHASVALYSLKHFMPELIKKYPELKFSLRHGLSREITEQVISYKIDFGIVVNPVPHPDLVIQSLCSDEVTFWISKNKSVSEDTLICDSQLNQSQSLIKNIRKKGYEFKSTLESTSLEVIADLAASGCGVAILPTRVAQLNSNLKLYSKGAKPIAVFKDQISLIYRADYQKSAAAKVISAAIKKSVK